MKTINLKDEQVELLRFLINDSIERLYIQCENAQTEDTANKLVDYADEVMELYYEVEAQLNKSDDEIGYINSQITIISSFLEDAIKEGDVIGINQYEKLLKRLKSNFYEKVEKVNT